MPSLDALREFRTSFHDIANERDDVTASGMSFDEFELPKTEAPPFQYSRQAIPPSAASPAADTGSGDFDFSAFLNDVPGDTPAAPDDLDDILGDIIGESKTDDSYNDPIPDDSSLPSDDMSFDNLSLPDDSSAGGAPSGDNSFLSDLLGDTNAPPKPDFASDIPEDGTIPDDLLAGLSDEMESAPSDFDTGGAAADNFENDDPDAIDLGGESQSGDFNMDDFNLPDFDENTDNSAFPDNSSDSDFPAADFGEDSIDMGGESPDIDDDEKTEDFPDFPGDDLGSSDFNSPLSDFDLPADDAGLSDFDLPADDAGLPDFDSQLPDMDFPAGDDTASGVSSDFDAGLSDFEIPAEDIGSFDIPSSDFASDTMEFDTEPHPAAEAGTSHGVIGFGEDDEFNIPGLDEMFDKSKTQTILSAAPKKKGLFGGFGKKEKTEEVPAAEDTVEEIALSQDDLDNLLKTLSLYPLNLRIICEELIAEQVILPQQLSKLVKLLVSGAHVKETAAHVESITGKPVVIPKSFEKSTGAALEAEQSTFAYIFIHNFLPVLRLFAVIAALIASVIYLSYQFIYIPLRADSLYKRGYERIAAGEYQRANELFHQAFSLHRTKKWFYAYAEAFRDQRRFMLAEGKYDELLRYYPRDKKGVLDYASLQTYYMMNYDKANRLLQRELLDFAPNDFQGLLAAGDNFLAWADSDPSRFGDRYDDARFMFARLLELYGWQVPIVERMLKYFIRTDNLFETLKLRVWFENDDKRKLSAESLAELGGYLLDKQLEEPKGVPNPYIESIESVRAMLLEAVRANPNLPESHYHLARYHKNLGNTYEERLTLENAIRAYNLAPTETVKQRLNRVDTHYRYAELLINNREFFPAENQLNRGVELYRDYLTRNLIRPSPELGRLYAAKGDLEFYVKTGDRQAAGNAIAEYRRAEEYGYMPPDMLYRMGAAYYQTEDWGNALNYLFRASADMPLNRRLLHALGNAAYQRGDYFAAQGYYTRLLDVLESQRLRLPVLLPNDNPLFLELGERLMMARNNAGVVYEALAEQTGNREFRSRALTLYAQSALAWDSITRNPETMVRMRLSEVPGAPGINLGYLNSNNALQARTDYTPSIFIRIDRDGEEPSRWEELAPFGSLQ